MITTMSCLEKYLAHSPEARWLEAIKLNLVGLNSEEFKSTCETVVLRNSGNGGITSFVSVAGVNVACETILHNTGSDPFVCIVFDGDVPREVPVMRGAHVAIPDSTWFAVKFEWRVVRVAFFFNNHRQIIYDK